MNDKTENKGGLNKKKNWRADRRMRNSHAITNINVRIVFPQRSQYLFYCIIYN